MLAVLLLGTALTLQARTLEGRVMAGAQPVANQPVALHRVTGGGGETIGADTTDAQGRFSFPYTPAGEGIHFVATRYEDKLYIGETFRDAPTDASYLVAVGPGATPMELGPAPASPATQPAPNPQSKRAGLFVVLFATLIGVAVTSFAMSRRSDPTRRILLEIAELDNRHEADAVDGYEAQRAELLRRLRETA